MDELLKKLLEAEVLTEDTKKELQEAFAVKLTEAVEQARQDVTATVTAELNEKWISERDMLIEAIDAKVSEVLESELDDLRESIESFRDLEAEFAEKLVEAKGEMAVELQKDLAELIEKLDIFLEMRLSAEIEELREDINVQKKKQFGAKVFEAFQEEFKKYVATDDSAEGKLEETEVQLADVQKQLEESERLIAKMQRKEKLQEVLSPLSGRTKEVMFAILERVDTALLEDAYKTYIGRVLKETTVVPTESTTSEKEETVLAEGKENQENGMVKTGDDLQTLTENEVRDAEPTNKLSDDTKASLRRLSGIIRQ